MASQPPNFSLLDTSTDQSSQDTGTPYTGPVSGPGSVFIALTPDNLNIKADTPNTFIRTGPGEDAIDSSIGGNNVLDGATGSNFLVGSTTGIDQFCIDDRAPSAPIWSTIVNFHPGDTITVFGLTPADFKPTWVDNGGASGYTGATMHLAGNPTVSLTLDGFQTGDLNSKLSTSFGHSPDQPSLPGSDYMMIKFT